MDAQHLKPSSDTGKEVRFMSLLQGRSVHSTRTWRGHPRFWTDTAWLGREFKEVKICSGLCADGK